MDANQYKNEAFSHARMADSLSAFVERTGVLKHDSNGEGE